MQDITGLLSSLRRPGLLLRAARLGMSDYRRDRHLPRHLGYGPLPKSGQAVLHLIEIEGTLDAQRRAQDAGYSLVRHVDVLIALLSEARDMRAARG